MSCRIMHGSPPCLTFGAMHLIVGAMSPASSTRAPLVRSAVLNGYADLARALGLDPLRMLAAAGLPLASLVDPDLRIPVLQVGRLLTESAARTRRPDFGLLLAEKRSLANLGPLGLVAREQPTLRRAIDMLAPSIAMHNEALSLRIEDAGDVTILRVVRHDGDAAPMDQRNELALAALMRMLRRLTDDVFVAESVHFTHRAPADLATHRRLFGVTPVFSQDFDGIVIATRLLDPDNGPADGLNKGFAAARGSIFGFINADDLLLPGALARVAAAFADPAVDVVLGNGVVIDDTDRHIRNAQSSRFSRVAYGHGAMTFIQQGCFFRAEAFARVGGFNAANRTSWDAELLIDMAVAGARIVNIPDRLGAFRLYGDTITGSVQGVGEIRLQVGAAEA